MAITHLATDASGGAFATTVSTSAANHTAGNFLYVFVTTGSNNSATFNTPTDTAGNTYHNFAACRISGAGGGFIGTAEVYYAYNILGNAANVVTITWTGSMSVQIDVQQYSGVLSASDPADVAAIGHQATSTSVTSASFTPTDANGIAIAGVGTDQASEVFTAGTNYTLRVNNTFNVVSQTQDFIGTGTGSQTASMSYGTTGSAFITVATFKAAAATDTLWAASCM